MKRGGYNQLPLLKECLNPQNSKPFLAHEEVSPGERSRGQRLTDVFDWKGQLWLTYGFMGGYKASISKIMVKG